MYKFNKVIILLFLVIFSTSSYAHIEHYTILNRIEFDIYRNNKLIGKHVFTFKRFEKKLEVESEINFQIKKLGVTLYKYHVKGTETYNGSKLIKFNSKTDQNGKQKYVI